MPNDKVVLVRRALNSLKEVGWCQRKLVQYNSDDWNFVKPQAFCALGALNWNIRDTGAELGIIEIKDLMARLIPESGFQIELESISSPLIQYNDHSSTTKQDIVSLFERALAVLEGDGNENGK